MCIWHRRAFYWKYLFLYFFEKEENLQKQQLRGLYLEQQIENQRLYYRNLEVSNEEIRKIRHDLKNAFAALSGYLNAENIEDAKKYVDKHVENLGELTYNTGHPAVDAVINNKNQEQMNYKSNLMLIYGYQKIYTLTKWICVLFGECTGGL